MLWAIGYLLAAYIFLKLFLKLIRYFSPSNDYNIENDFLSSRYNAVRYTETTQAVTAKMEARRALDNLKNDNYAHRAAQLERERSLQEAEFQKAVSHLCLNWKHDEEKANFQMRTANAKAAANAGLDLPTYNLNAGEVFKERGLAQSRVDEQRQLKQIELDAELQSQLNTIRAILEYKNIDYNRFDSIKERMFHLIDEESRIEDSHTSAFVKGQKLELNRKAKQMYLGVLHGIENRLLETGDTQDVSGIETLLADSRGLSANTGATFEDAISALVTRNRGPVSNHSRRTA